MASTLPTRSLGALEVPAIGFGAMVLVPGMYGAADADASEATLRHAIDAGATFLDTSDAYGADGDNERLVGRAVAGRREAVQLATKWGIVAEGGRRVQASYANEIRVDLTPAHAAAHLDASLRRLGTDHVDLWYPHFPDPSVPIEETVGAMAEQVALGKARHLGLSNVTVEQVLAAHQVHPIAAVQVEHSLWTRDAEAELLPVLRELGIGLVAWSPLGSGFFAGAPELGADDFRHNAPRFSGGNLEANRDRFAPLRELAGELGLTPAQLALAWSLHVDPRLVPIPGTRAPAHLDENLAAAAVTLPGEVLARIDALAPAGHAAGASLLEGAR